MTRPDQIDIINFMRPIGNDAPWWGEFSAQYKEASKLARGAHVLDVGCGHGYGSRDLFDNGALSVHGIDSSTEAIDYAKSNCARDGVTFEVQDICDPYSLSEKYDLITCFQVLELVSAPNLMMQNLVRLTRPKGTLILTTVNRARNSHLHESPCDPSHFVEFNYEELCAFLKRWFPAVEVMSLACTKEGGSQQWENRLIEKIPLALKDAVYQKVMGESYYPEASDYVLRSAASAGERLFYAVCKKG